jgi:hypothetical protein
MTHKIELEDDGRFECKLGHVHDKDGLPGPTGEGAPCPNDPESPNAYPEDSFVCHTDEDGTDHIEVPTGYVVLLLTDDRPFVYGPYPNRTEAEAEAAEHRLNHPELADGSEGSITVVPVYDGWAAPATSLTKEAQCHLPRWVNPDTGACEHVDHDEEA